MRALLTRLLRFARRRRYLAIWSVGLLVIALIIGAAYSRISPLDRLNYLVFDAYQTLKPREATESAVAVVDIDDESIRQFGQWPWSRTVLAAVIDRLAEAGAAAIGLDMILSEPDRTSPALAVTQLENQGFRITAPASSTSASQLWARTTSGSVSSRCAAQASKSGCSRPSGFSTTTREPGAIRPASFRLALIRA